MNRRHIRSLFFAPLIVVAKLTLMAGLPLKVEFVLTTMSPKVTEGVSAQRFPLAKSRISIDNSKMYGLIGR